MRKKGIACLLAVCLGVGGMPQNADAQVSYTQEEALVQSADQIVEGETQDTKAEQSVTVIVEVKATSMLALFQKSADKDLSRFFDAHEAQRQAIQKQIESVKTAILNLSQQMREKTEILYTYDTVFSGFSLNVPYSALEKIKKLPNVKRAFVAATYQLPEDQTEKSAIQQRLADSCRMICSNKVQNQLGIDYTGKGQTIAILDSGVSVEHEAFAKKPEEQHYTMEGMQELLDTENLSSETDFSTYNRQTLNATSGGGDCVYKSDKIPFAYDYMGHDTSVTPVMSAYHGTHVSGIAVGDSEKIQGVAPDAQLLMMKVFDDNGSSNDAALLAALQDVVLLQADSVNMSLGTDAGFSTDENEAMQQVYDRIKAAGINLSVAAGNAATSANYSELGNDATVENIDNGIVSNPSTLSAALSVASIENETINDVMFFQDSEGQEHEFTESESAVKKFADLEKGTYTYVDCGLGDADAFQNIDVNGKIALIARGGLDADGEHLTFAEKVKNAANAGAKAVIIYNNVEGSIEMSIEDSDYLLPAISVTKKVGETLIGLMKNGEGSVFFDPSLLSDLKSEQANQMSTFSSWGPTPDLGIKPEITAPGGNIYSAYYVDGNGSSVYGNMSGTSMASPHIAGAAVVIRQYLKEEHPEYTAIELQEAVNTRLMSTAVPIKDSEKQKEGESVYVPVRQQGAGLINLEAAIKTPAYMTVKGSERPKAELGDRADGCYAFTAQITNTGETDLSYQMETSVQVPNDKADGRGKKFVAQDDHSILNAGADVTCSGSTVSGNTVIVPAGETVDITVQILLDVESAEIQKESEIFTNGFYVEGFLIAKSTIQGVSDLSVPYLGFYKDWSAQSLFDVSAYEDGKTPVFAANCLHTPNLNISSFQQGKNKQIILGQNPLAVAVGEENQVPNQAHIVISQNSKYVNMALPTTSLMRGADTLEYKMVDANGSVVKNYVYDLVPKTYYLPGENVLYTAEEELEDFNGQIYFNGKDKTGKRLPEGMYSIIIEGKKSGVTDEKKRTEQLIYPITIDDTEPQIEEDGCEIYEKDGKLYVRVTAKDNHGLAGFALKMQSEAEKTDRKYLYTNCLKEDCQVFELGEVSELLEKGVSIDKMTVEAYDYAMNSASMQLEKSAQSDVSSLPPNLGSIQPSDSLEPSGQPAIPSESSKPSEQPAIPSESSRPSELPTIASEPSRVSEQPILPSQAENVKTLKKAVVKKTVSKKDGTISIQVSKISGAAEYEIYRSTKKNGTYKRLLTTKKTTAIDKKTTFGNTYYYKVRAHAKIGKQDIYGPFSKICAGRSEHFGTMKLNAVKQTASAKLKVSWTKMAGADGYEIYRSTKKNGNYKKVKIIRKKSTVTFVDVVKNKKTYYYKIRPIGKIGSRTVKGTFSMVKMIKMK
ncbi:MAG: S8 family serine peptidase [Lachnospiraceae bacterium]